MPEKIQNYTVSDRIGTGGTGVVRRGRDTEAKTDVAVKSLNADLVREPQVRKRLKEATKSLQSMPRQENLVRVLDVVESGDTMHVIMEYAPGRSLDNLLSKKSRPMPHESALQLLNGALRGAMAAHSKGFLHGNLKPSDIIISGDNTAKIEGFGIAPLLGNAALARAAGRTGKIAYMSPEQVRGEGVDERSDVYSLGVILYRMITGKMPFTVSDRDSESRLRQAILQQTTPDITEEMPELNIPPYLANVVKRAIAKDRRERIPTTREFARLLQKVQPEVQQIIASTPPAQTASTTGAVLGTAAVAAAATGAAISGAAETSPRPAMQIPPQQASQQQAPPQQASLLASESNIAPQQSPENTSEQTIAEAQADTSEQGKPREKSGLSAFFSKTPDPAPAPSAPTVFTAPTLTKTPMQLEVERRMQAMRAEQAMAEQERLSTPPSPSDNEAFSTFGSLPNESSSNLPPTPEALSTKLTPTEPIKPAAKNEEKKKRTVLPWLVMGAVALGGGIYYVALKNKGADGASQPAQRELSKDEQERRYDSLLSKSEKSAEQEQTAAEQNNAAPSNDKQANADTVANNSPESLNNNSSTQAAETTAPKNAQPTSKNSATESEKPRIPSSNETPKAAEKTLANQAPTQAPAKQVPATKASETKGKASGNQVSGNQVSASQASENKMLTSKSTAKKAGMEKALAENSIAEPTPKKTTQPKRTKTSESTATQENAAPATTSNTEPRKASRTAASSERSANKTMSEKRTSETTPTGNTNSASAKSANAKTTPKSGSLAEANAETVAEREAAKERIRQKYANHLKSKEKKPSTLATNAPSTNTEAPAGKSTPDALKDMNKKAPRTNREDNYAPATNPVSESPNTVDPSATELVNAARKAKGVEPFLILRGHIGNVRSVSFSPDGKTIASGSDDKTVKIWDAATGTILRSLRGHSGTVTSVFFSPDGKTLISSGKDKTVRVWDAATGEAIQRSPGVSCEGTPAAFSPDGKFLATTDSRNINISKVQR